MLVRYRGGRRLEGRRGAVPVEFGRSNDCVGVKDPLDSGGGGRERELFGVEPTTTSDDRQSWVVAMD